METMNKDKDFNGQIDTSMFCVQSVIASSDTVKREESNRDKVTLTPPFDYSFPVNNAPYISDEKLERASDGEMLYNLVGQTTIR